MGTSSTRSSGISKSSGSFPLACSRRGSTSKRPLGAFQPSWVQIWKETGRLVLLLPKHTQQTYCTEKRELVWSPPAHLSELYVSRVSQDAPVWLLVAGIPDELTVPHPVVVFAVCPLRKDGDGRPAATQTATHTAKHKQTATQPNQSVGAEQIRKSTQTRTR